MAGRWAPGDSLPGENVLAAEHRMTAATVRKAMQVLRDEGIIRTRKGAGTTVAHVPPRVTVEISPGDIVTTRMPTPDERRALGIPEGVWVVSVRTPGAAEKLFDGSRAQITTVTLSGDPVRQAQLAGVLLGPGGLGGGGVPVGHRRGLPAE